MGNMLIKQAQIITMNASEDIFTGDIRIVDDRIAAIAPHLAEEPGDYVIHGVGRTLIPGFVQTHIHLCQTLFRGKGDDLELMDWLRKRIWPLEASHDEESIYYSAMLGIGELIQSGTTTIVDMETVHHTESAFQAIAASGIRALSGKVMMDKGTEVPLPLQEKTEDSIQQSVDLLERWNGYDGGRIQYAFCPRFVVSCTETLLREVQSLSASYGVKVHTHASENLGEIEIVQAETGMRNVVYLDHLGLANERLILAHCIWLDEEEKRIIRERGVHVSHCPGSNLKLASGIAETPEMLKLDISVSLGADGAPCNNNLDMFNEMRLAALIQKPVHGPTAMNARSVFRMATIGGARAVGMEKEIGSIEVGKKADLALLNLNAFHTFPSYDVDPISRIVYSATRADVETTIINGRIVMEKGIMRTIDPLTVLAEADRSIQRLLKRAALPV
ncbi:5'-deoxyadenosine deaminase [Paenibacillus mucilaginosus]|uniref:N-ethylammeline chlorohydrolase n=2 Tax=Paenibacillus mucilaginosus TaxID=61624 RepID=H6NEM5_9BACL|nr:5'-deoxyadenosine deaminase [Paenibacillus mucilaginosus]AEI39644.1 N-ethylammeline chlorohydrolase [Paenibacillus mucilaginosus KNP414]AFC28329.1 N-ethylammeline chlorohydrolase [Paenibacillus mucilaginosus 3016]MCG7217739.1 5'-deoxyadenosine deaminase [Paenibacillus mucilaginosus]WDM28956.1 5'-deoxyadenosine deaminase [Paenibacillus mucilaginosus]WFA17132.1 5'-deoxyadenosine deaminase [Paenibacillus mucilaginosus]